MPPKDGTAPPPKGGSAPPERERLTQQVAVLQKAAKAQAAARSLRDRAAKVANPQERERMIKEAYNKEVEANGQSKLAQRMQSGAWQGAAGGGGIGAATGLGVGAVVGTLVGGLLSVPTTGLGGLIGAGVGAIHGPFIKIGGQEKKWEDAQPEEVVDALEQGQVEQLPDAEAPGPSQARKKPRKIEVRSTKRTASSNEPTSSADGQGTTEGTEDAVRKDRPDLSNAEHESQASSPTVSQPRKPRKIAAKPSSRRESNTVE